MKVRQVLDDLVVVEISDEPAGVFCGKVFADLGAAVWKIEAPQGGTLRRQPGTFTHLNTNKRSVVVDAGDVERLWSVIERAHIVIESLGWGDLASWGIDVEEVRDRSPSAVVVTISGFGASGPYADYRWTDIVGQAFSWATLPGVYTKTQPVRLPGTTALCLTGQTAALGGLAGLLRARASGVGARVDCAMYEALGAVPSRVARFLGWQYNQKKPTMVLSTTSSDFLLPLGIYPCLDGYISVLSTPQQLDIMLELLDDDGLRAAFARPDAFVRGDTKEVLDAVFYPWLLRQSRAELTEAAQAVGWPLAGVNTPADVLDADHFHQRNFWAFDGQLLLPGPPYRHAEGGWRLRRSAPGLGQASEDGAPQGPALAKWSGPVDPDAPPLRGVRVLDLTLVWAGPYATQLLADLGAEVIRLENPSIFPPSTKGYEPRPSREMLLGELSSGYARPVGEGPDRPYNRHSMNNAISRNKLSCTLDPRRTEGKELLLRLVEKSDVFIESLKMSSLHRMGIQEGELMDRNPRLVILRIPPAGLDGDWSHYKGFGAQFDALSGFTWLSGHHDEEVVQAPASTYMDAATGPAAAFAVIAALHYRDVTGRGQAIELAQLENVIGHLGDVLVDMQLGVPPRRVGNRHPVWAPQGLYPCKGEFRWLAVSVTSDTEWAALAGLVGGQSLVENPDYVVQERRMARHDELDAIISEWTSRRDVMEAFHLLQGSGIPAAPLLVDDLLEGDDHIRQRGWVGVLPARDVGTYPHIGRALSGIPQEWRRGAPALGEDNRYVYQDILGLDDVDYRRLIDLGIAVEDYLDADGRPV